MIKPIYDATFIGQTLVSGVKKDRWECPSCRKRMDPDRKFNVTPNKRNMLHTCRSCGEKLRLKK